MVGETEEVGFSGFELVADIDPVGLDQRKVELVNCVQIEADMAERGLMEVGTVVF